jgi:RIO kinase 2
MLALVFAKYMEGVKEEGGGEDEEIEESEEEESGSDEEEEEHERKEVTRDEEGANDESPPTDNSKSFIGGFEGLILAEPSSADSLAGSSPDLETDAQEQQAEAEEGAEGESESDEEYPRQPSSAIKELVQSSLSRDKAKQRKHHSKKGVKSAGRSKGSKAKQDTRVKIDRGGVWE